MFHFSEDICFHSDAANPTQPFPSPTPQVPKVCMHLMVNSTKEFISNELIAHLYRSSPEDLMEESPEETKRREELLQMYQTSKKALKIIGDINLNTKSEPLPPPVENDIRVDGPPTPTAPSSRPAPAPSRKPQPRAPPRPASGTAPVAPSSRPPPPSQRPAPVAPGRPNIPSRPSVPSRPR